MPAPPTDLMEKAARLLAAFLADKTPATARAYRADLDAFARHLGGLEVTAAVADLLGWSPIEAQARGRDYRQALKDAGLAANTINRRLASLRSLVRHARLAMGFVGWDILLRPMRTVIIRDTAGPPQEVIEAMFLRAREQGGGKGFRDVALLAMLYGVALRRSEVVELDCVHLSLDGIRPMVSIKGKGRHDREEIAVSDDVRGVLLAWLTARGTDPGPMFTTMSRAYGDQPMRRLSGEGLAYVVRRLGEKANAPKRVAPHALRHAGITAAVAKSEHDETNAFDIAQFARHRNIQTTRLYIDNRDMTAYISGRIMARML